MLISTGAKWHSRRKLITGTFHFKNLLDFLDVFNEQNRKFIQKLEKHVEGSDFNMYEYITSLALDNICGKTLFLKRSVPTERVLLYGA